MQKYKKIGIGYEDYREFIDGHMYYIDKTLLIRDVLEQGGKVTLFTRPRRFGKTLALSMIRTFFEQEYDFDGNVIDKRHYFEGMKIMGESSEILSMMGAYPVIRLSLKSARQPDFRTSVLRLRDEILGEFGRHEYLLRSERMDTRNKKLFESLINFKPEEEIRTDEELKTEAGRYVTAMKTLSDCLKQHHERNVIILLDEYDVPLENAYYCGFYDEMTGFIRSLFESALKTNDSLEFAVITGCLRISRESIFTGMNNLQINSIRDFRFNEAFGFTSEEVEKMLRDYDLGDRIDEARDWYDGYLFGDKEIYNPWSITKYVDGISGGKSFPEPYWANTSSNAIVRDMVCEADADRKRELDVLISGGSIEKKIHEDITYGDLHESEDNLWNFLFFTGYMKKVSERKEGRDIYVTMKIPNEEILSIYENQIRSWFEKKVKETDRREFYKAVLEGNAAGMTGFISSLLGKTISTFDSSESFYHGFFLSLVSGVPDYNARSNREEGTGRPDIVLYPDRSRDPAIIFELKVRRKFSEMENGLQEAFQQIREKGYEEGVLEEGYAGSVSYGVCFCKKSCVIEQLQEL